MTIFCLQIARSGIWLIRAYGMIGEKKALNMKQLLGISMLLIFFGCSPNCDDPCIDRSERFTVMYETDYLLPEWEDAKYRLYGTFERDSAIPIIAVIDGFKSGIPAYDSASLEALGWFAKYNDSGEPVLYRANYNPQELSADIKCKMLEFENGDIWNLVE